MAWDASPVSTARMCAEVWEQIKGEDWTLATETHHYGYWPYRLWNMEKHSNTIGGSGAAGVGYNAPGALGAALANKALGRLTLRINGDGDLLMSQGFWDGRTGSRSCSWCTTTAPIIRNGCMCS
jgi:thiamine pyrophosphate-dependent acetolactate synthase large subunit-like protein